MLGSHPVEIALGSTYDRQHLKTILPAMADAGLAVFFCKTDGKEPDPTGVLAPATYKKMAADGQNMGAGMATTSKPMLARWLKRWRDTHPEGVHPNLAVNPGLSRLIVVDCDTGEERDAFLQHWADTESWEDDPNAPYADITPTVLTPGERGPDGEWKHRDGGHYYFTLPDGWEVPQDTKGVFKMPGGWAVYMRDCYVLVPPSVRPEGPYRMAGRVREAPEWLLDLCSSQPRRAERAERAERSLEAAPRPESPVTGGEPTTATTDSSETFSVTPDDSDDQAETDIDTWASQQDWESLLTARGYRKVRPDKCGPDCWIYTAPGVHASPKSATAHGPVCSEYDPAMGHGPLHFWTDNPPEGFEGKGTYTVIQFIAAADHGGDIAAALESEGIAREPEVQNLKVLDFSHIPVDENGESWDPIIGSFDWDMEPPEPLIEGLLFRQTHVMLIGEPSAGKSFTALDMACCIAMGVPWQGRPTYQGHVVYVAGEGYRGVVQRVKAWADEHGFTLADLDRFLHRVRDPHSIPGEKAGVETRLWWSRFGHELDKLQPELTIIDTMQRVSVGLKENDASDMARVVQACDAIIAATEGTVMLLHHTARSTQHARGSTALLGSVDTELFVRANPDMPGVTGAIELVTTKQKDAERGEPIPLMIAKHGASAVIQGMTVKALAGTGADPLGKAVLEHVRGSERVSLRITDITLALSTTYKQSAVKEAIAALLKAGKLEHPQGTRGRMLTTSVQLCDTSTTSHPEENESDDDAGTSEVQAG